MILIIDWIYRENYNILKFDLGIGEEEMNKLEKGLGENKILSISICQHEACKKIHWQQEPLEISEKYLIYRWKAQKLVILEPRGFQNSYAT